MEKFADLIIYVKQKEAIDKLIGPTVTILNLKPRPPASGMHFIKMPPGDPVPLDSNDPFSICFIDRKIKAKTPVFFHKGHPDGASVGTPIRSVEHARGSFASPAPRQVVPGYYSITHNRGGETLTEGECNRLKFKQKPDGLHVYMLPYA